VSGDSWTFAQTAALTLTNNYTGFVVNGITFNSGTGATTFVGNTLTIGGTLANNAAAQITFNNNIILTNTFSITSSANGNIQFSGNLSGNGTITQTFGGSAANVIFAGDNSGFTGSFTQDGSSANRTAFNTATAGSANAAWSFNRAVNGGVAIGFGAGTLSFGSLSGGGWFRNNNATTSTIRVGDLNTNSTFSGALNSSAGTFILLKAGTGTQTMSGGSSYSGGTIVQAGTLRASGNTGAFGTVC
jgi:autotransporter-associated beta strand protein